MNNNKGIWVWVIIIVVIILVALGLWWVSANQSVNSSTNMATSTSATSTQTTGTTVVPTSNMSGDTVKQIVESLPNASEYQSLFSSTGVAASLSAGGKYTIFVPTDSAFTNVTKGTISKMTATQLKRLVQYSIIATKEVQVGTQTLGEVQALSGDPLNFSDTNNIPMVNSAIVVSEYQGSNGIVYVINDVLIPPQASNE